MQDKRQDIEGGGEMKEKATIFNYARMCNHFDDNCQECPMFYKQTETGLSCKSFIRNCPDKANEIILNWCKEHPVETRQDRFLKQYPNAATNEKGRINICPKSLDCDYDQCGTLCCADCRNEYWLAEVDGK